MAAKRIQLRRSKGWRKPEGAIVVSRPSKWGNPHKPADIKLVSVNGEPVDPELQFIAPDYARRLAVAAFRQWLEEGKLPVTVEDVRRELRGKDLACWCPLPKPGEPDVCHAAVLLEVANG